MRGSSVFTRIIKAILLAAVLSFCLVNPLIVHANAGSGGNGHGGYGGGNSLGWDRGYDDPPRVFVRNPDPPRLFPRPDPQRPIVPISVPPRAVAPEFDPRLLAGSVAILAGVLLLTGQRRGKLKT
jgi:hypothetical protein